MRKDEDLIEITKDQKSDAAYIIKKHLETEYGIEVGNLQAELFVDIITENMGKYYYNKGILDSISLMNDKVEDMYLLMKDE